MTAAAAKAPHKSNVKNPSNLPVKTAAAAAAAKPAATNKINPHKKHSATGARGQESTHRRKSVVRRNPSASGLISMLILALGGALTICGFDFAVETFAPRVSGGIKTGAKFLVGLGFDHFGKKIPIIGAYSGTIAKTLYVFGFVDLIKDHAIPLLSPYLPQALNFGASGRAPQLIAPPTPAKDPATGELGMLHQMDDGSQYLLIDQSANQGYGYAY